MMSYEIPLQFLHNGLAVDVFDRVLVWVRSSALNVAHVADGGEQEKRAEISTVFNCRVAEIILGECRERLFQTCQTVLMSQSPYYRSRILLIWVSSVHFILSTWVEWALDS